MRHGHAVFYVWNKENVIFSQSEGAGARVMSVVVLHENGAAVEGLLAGHRRGGWRLGRRVRRANQVSVRALDPREGLLERSSCSSL